MSRRVVEPAETFQLSKHVPGRAIKVCFDDAAAREGLAELGGNILGRSRRRLGALRERIALLLRNPEEHDLLEIIDLLRRHSLFFRFLRKRKERPGTGARLLHVQAARDEFGAVGRAPVRGDKAAKPVFIAQYVFQALPRCRTNRRH